MEYFKDNPGLIKARLKPARAIAVLPGDDTVTARLAHVHNRIGGLIAKFSQVTGVPPAAALAVWYVESAGAPFQRGRPILRFENHKFFAYWGKDHVAQFDSHFQFGGHAGIPGKPWEHHRVRIQTSGDWRSFHGNQQSEYEVFGFASTLAGREPACRSASFGGPQIMGFNHAIIGYASALELFQAFSRSERWQVIGFFDFCRAKNLIEPIKQQLWLDFATTYNGPGNASQYESKLIEALEHAKLVL